MLLSRARRSFGPFAVAVACLLTSAVTALAQEASDAMFVTVQNPITTDAFRRIQNQIKLRMNDANQQRRPSAIVFDFNPDDKPAATTDFGPCFDLAEFIGGPELQGKVNTIAFVHAPVTGHTVLPVLACKERVMRDKTGAIGPIVVEGVPPLLGTPGGKLLVGAYQAKINPDLWPLVQKMYDPGVKLVKGKPREGADRAVYADERDTEAVKRLAGVGAVQGVQDGQYASYPAQLARSVGLAQARADSRPEVAEVYGLPPSSVRDDPLGGRTPEAFQWVLTGDIDGAKRESVNRIIRDVRKKKGNVLILIFKECDGTDLDAARGLAEDLIKAQQGDEAIQIIAFIPETAPNAAAVVALGCSEIVMTKPKAPDAEAKEAEFGNFERYLKSAKPGAIDAQRKSIRELAEQRGYSGILIDGMFDRSVEIVRASARDNPKKTKLMTRAEFSAELKANPGAWNETPKVIKPRDVPFHPNATLATELGLARFTVPSTSVNDVCEIYGVKEARSPDSGWIDKLADFLRIPAVTIILVMLGFIGLILELKVPGLTVPGIIAALCFILVFWSQSRFSGEMFVLALLLFVLGLVLVGLEIFVLPGFGVCGICGILFMLAGLGLVTLEKVPTNAGEWVGFGERVSYYLFALMGAMVMAFLIAKFLPQVPYANRMMLTPPADHPNAADPVLPGAIEALELLGAIGTTTTALRPAGVVRFGDKFVDVVSDGGFIPLGTRVQVITVEGTRIVVKEV
jgi:membrane-bound serine protease (ClpP class)